MKRRRFLTSATLAGVGVGLREAGAAQVPPETVLSSARAPLRRPKTGLIQVACAVSRNTTKIDYIGPEAVFETWLPGVSSSPEKQFRIFTVSDSTQPVSGVVPDYTFETAPPAHVVVVPAQIGSPALLEWLRAVHQTADVTMSVCTGARHLALAGLLKGRVATSHAKSLAGFVKEFPDVQWVGGLRFVEGDKVSTSGGLTAGIDLALRIVERYFSRQHAEFVADHLEYEGQRWKV